MCHVRLGPRKIKSFTLKKFLKVGLTSSIWVRCQRLFAVVSSRELGSRSQREAARAVPKWRALQCSLDSPCNIQPFPLSIASRKFDGANLEVNETWECLPCLQDCTWTWGPAAPVLLGVCGIEQYEDSTCALSYSSTGQAQVAQAEFSSIVLRVLGICSPLYKCLVLPNNLIKTFYSNGLLLGKQQVFCEG